MSSDRKSISIVRWEDPPPPSTRAHSVVLDETLAELKRHPGEWALIRTGAKAFGGVQARKADELYGDLGFEFVGRRLKSGSGALYGRFLGEPSGEIEEHEDVDEDEESPARRRIREAVDREREKRRGTKAAEL